MSEAAILDFPEPAPKPRLSISLGFAEMNMHRSFRFIIDCRRERGEIPSDDCLVILREGHSPQLPYRACVVIQFSAGEALEVPLDIWPFWYDLPAPAGLADVGGAG